MIENTEELQGQLIATGNVIASMVAQKGNKGDKGDKGDTGAQGVPGQDGFSPSASVSKVGSTATITITDKDGTTTATISDGLGDMLKSVYDTDDDGIVDNAEKVNNHTVLSDVPADAVFTDTTYTAGTGISISSGNVISNTQTSAEWGNITGTLADQTDLNTALGNKADSSSLATVATSGSYADLSNTPTIPTKISDLTNDSDFIEKSNTAGLVKNDGTIDTTSYSTFSGSYNDLSNKPTIPDELADLTDDSTHRVVTDAEKTTWSGKQDALVSGTNIKTINSTSLLGSGDIELGTSIPIQDTAPLNPEEDDLWIDTSSETESLTILDAIYPVGSIIIRDDSTDYSSWLGFTWSKVFAGRVLVGQDTSQTEFDTIGETGGEKTHTLTTQEMPSHNHGFTDAVAKWYAGKDDQLGGSYDTRTNGYLTQTTNSGGGQAHNNLQPYQVVAYWKRTA